MGLTDTLYRVKEFIVSGLHSLPIILTTFSLILACATANTGFAILFVFLALAVPLMVAILNMISPVFKKVFDLINNLVSKGTPINWSESMSDVCKIAPLLGAATGGDAAISAFPSYWTGIVSFFFGFVISNAYALYEYGSNENVPQEKSDTRKAHAVIGLILCAILFLMLITWRYLTGCEHSTGLGIYLSLGIGVSGFFIFRALNGCGLLRVIDIFGIGARLLPASATAEPTQVCFPVA